MSNFTNVPWPEVRIGDVLTYLNERVDLDDAAEYLTITVKRRHGGLEERERILGHQIQTKKQFRLIPGAFIISRVQCWHQAYAIVPDHIPPNMIASVNYDQFAVSPKVDRRFFWWLSHSPYFTETVRSSAFGVVIEKMVFNRDAWLEKPIPLPLFEEQRRIVARIEELAAKIHAARALRQLTEGAAKVLWARCAARIFEHLQKRKADHILADVVSICGGGTPSKANPSYWSGSIPWVTPKDMKVRELHGSIDHISELGIRESAAKLIHPGAVLVVVRGMILAHTFPSAVLKVPATVNQDMKALIPKTGILPEYLCTLFWALNDRFLALVEKSTHDTRKLETPALMNSRIPVPSLSEQREILSYLDGLRKKTESLRTLQAETSAELDALMPSILDKAFRGEL